MTELNRIYARTEAGLKAMENPGSGLPAEARWMLRLIKNETHGEAIRAGMGRYSEERIRGLLTELHRLRLVESVAATSEHDLDFTPNK
jgi:hypothetical protein